MDRWVGKVAVVTGASSGIGAAVCEELVRAGLTVVGLARRVQNVQKLADELTDAPGRLHPLLCDLANADEIQSAFRWMQKELGGADILVNNAGVLSTEPLLEATASNIREIMNINVIAAAVCTREAIASMRKRGVLGHVININSMAGHFADSIPIPLSVYPASKYALTAMTIGLRHEVTAAKLPIKVTSVSPGAVKTQMIETIGIKSEMLEKLPVLQSKDVADMVVFALSTPPHVEVAELTVYPLNATIPK